VAADQQIDERLDGVVLAARTEVDLDVLLLEEVGQPLRITIARVRSGPAFRTSVRAQTIPELATPHVESAIVGPGIVGREGRT
jgi:hypothetical protein